MKLYKYDSYEEYVAVQTKKNLSKIDCNFAQSDTLDFVAEKLIQLQGKVNRGVCHGTRNGFEQKYLREKLGADVIGTEISYSATQFPHTIQLDFHEVKEEWLGAMDFIYSNSIDHSYDPDMCLEKWISCLRKGGYLILHWTWQNPICGSRSDPFGATLGELIDLLMVNKNDTSRGIMSHQDREVEAVYQVKSKKGKHMKCHGPDWLVWVRKI